MATRQCHHASSVGTTHQTFFFLSTSSFLILSLDLAQEIVYFPGQSIKLFFKVMTTASTSSFLRKTAILLKLSEET